MANQAHLDLLKTNRNRWNVWRDEEPDIEPDLSRINLSGANLNGANLCNADLREANLSEAQLIEADLSRANLDRANLSGANLSEAHLNHAFLEEANLSKANLSLAVLNDATLRKADLREADFSGATLLWADLRGANLSKTDLSWANLSDAKLNGAQLVGCRIYAISAWDVELEKAKIDTITSKVVLILGRFTEERKKVLDALREELRNNHDLTPVVFDFDPSKNQDLTETVSTLAHMSRFIIADLTDPSSVPHELATIAPHCIRPIKPIILDQPMLINGQERERHEYAMFRDLRRRYDWVLPICRYHDTSSLIASIKEQIITPAEQKAQELEKG